jgi:hypothetical protein
VPVAFAISFACKVQGTSSPEPTVAEPTVAATANEIPAEVPSAAVFDEPDPADPVVDAAVPRPADEPPTQRPEPAVPTSAPEGKRWIVDDESRGPFGYVCVYWGGGKPRCREGLLTPIVSWSSRARSHDGTSKPDLVQLVRRRTTLGPKSFGLTNPEEVPIGGSHLTLRAFPSDGRVFVFIEIGEWLLEAESQRHAKSVRNDAIDLAKRIDAEVSSLPEERP